MQYILICVNIYITYPLPVCVCVCVYVNTEREKERDIYMHIQYRHTQKVACSLAPSMSKSSSKVIDCSFAAIFIESIFLKLRPIYTDM